MYDLTLDDNDDLEAVLTNSGSNLSSLDRCFLELAICQDTSSRDLTNEEHQQ